MHIVQNAIQKYFYAVLMMLLAGGFAILLAELLITQHTDGIQLVAVVAASVGLLLVLAAFFVSGRSATTVAVLLLLLSVTGLLGTVQHLTSGDGDGERAIIQRFETGGYQPIAFALDDDGDKATPPPLAPLSLAGLSLMGSVIVIGAPRKKAAVLES